MSEYYQNPGQSRQEYEALAKNYVNEKYIKTAQQAAYEELIADRVCSKHIQEVFGRYGFNLELPDIDADNIEEVVLNGNFNVMGNSVWLMHSSGASAYGDEEYRREMSIYGHAYRLVPRLFYVTRGDEPYNELGIKDKLQNDVRPLEIILADEVLSDDEKNRLMNAAQVIMGQEAFDKALSQISNVSIMARSIDAATLREQLLQEFEQTKIRKSILSELVDVYGDKFAWYSRDWDVMVPLPLGNDLRNSIQFAYNLRTASLQSAAAGIIITDARLKELSDNVTKTIQIAESMGLVLTEAGVVVLLNKVKAGLDEGNG